MMKLQPAIAAALLLAGGAARAHEHLSVGVSDTNGNGRADPDEPLAFIGGDRTERILDLLPRPAGAACGGYYALDEAPRMLEGGDGFSITVRSDGQYDLERPMHPVTGAWVWCEIVKVEGPPGGAFGFWDENHAVYEDTPSVTLIANQPTGNPGFVLSEGFDDAGEDPAGHIHGRAWTADNPGDYRVTIRLVDRSTNRPGGDPWHSPSPEYLWHFHAGPDFQPTMERLGAGLRLTWPSRMGIYDPKHEPGVKFTVLRSSAGFDWRPIGSVTGSTAETISFTDPAPPAGRAFYRLAYDWAER